MLGKRYCESDGADEVLFLLSSYRKWPIHYVLHLKYFFFDMFLFQPAHASMMLLTVVLSLLYVMLVSMNPCYEGVVRRHAASVVRLLLFFHWSFFYNIEWIIINDIWHMGGQMMNWLIGFVQAINVLGSVLPISPKIGRRQVMRRAGWLS